ncbi:MAG: hypothetical protein FWH04_07485 [Oscillospiraceae bacterium]|nr:hypothetical protein [Oscillospiraceae bacterium]
MFNVKVTVRENVSEKEKADRINQFRQAFVAAATSYYTSKPTDETKKESA